MFEKKLDVTIVPLYNKDMDIIIDSSCIIAVLLGEEESSKVREITKGTRLNSAACLPYEIERNRILRAIPAPAFTHQYHIEKELNPPSTTLMVPVTAAEASEAR